MRQIQHAKELVDEKLLNAPFHCIEFEGGRVCKLDKKDKTAPLEHPVARLMTHLGYAVEVESSSCFSSDRYLVAQFPEGGRKNWGPTASCCADFWEGLCCSVC